MISTRRPIIAVRGLLVPCRTILLSIALAAAPRSVFSQARLASAIGPFTLETERGTLEARLLRCDTNTLWIAREGASGLYEAGLPLTQVRRVVIPTPRAFLMAQQAATGEQQAMAHEALDRLIATLRPFRFVPGVPYFDALLQKARLYDRQGKWNDAIRIYDELLKQPGDAPWKNSARLYAGISLELAGQHTRALEMLEAAVLPTDDEELLSSALFARGMARTALDRHEEALMDFLYLVVFHPYIQNNEARGLDAALPCYAAIEDWESLLKTIRWLQKDYPDTAEARHAQKIYDEHRAQLEQAAQFVEGAPPSSSTTSGSASAASTATEEATIEDIEVD